MENEVPPGVEKLSGGRDGEIVSELDGVVGTEDIPTDAEDPSGGSVGETETKLDGIVGTKTVLELPSCRREEDSGDCGKPELDSSGGDAVFDDDIETLVLELLA